MKFEIKNWHFKTSIKKTSQLILDAVWIKYINEGALKLEMMELYIFQSAVEKYLCLSEIDEICIVNNIGRGSINRFIFR
jgi:hypothetical protein